MSSHGRVRRRLLGAGMPPLLLTSVATAPRRHRILLSVLVTSVAFTLLAALAHRVPYFDFDVAITRWVQQAEWPIVTVPLNLLSAMGFPPLVAVVYGIIALVIFIAGWRVEGCMAAVGGLLGAALNNLGKMIVDRPRPPQSLVHVGRTIPSSTFPAGHVLNATIFFGFLLYLVSTRMAPSWRRTTAQVLLVFVIVGMGIARIHSGEHWPSDVVGGYLLGWIGLVGTTALYRKLRGERTRRWVTMSHVRVSTTTGRSL